MRKTDILVIGAGASGLIAAGYAAEQGADVVLLEHKSTPARKLLITGKGRCNLTNAMPQPEFLNHFHPNGRFLRTAFSQFFSEDLREMFHQLGVKTVVERGGRVFPESGKAQEVVEALVNWNRQVGVKLLSQTAAHRIQVDEGCLAKVLTVRTVSRKGKVVKAMESSEEIECGAVILATGGASYPATGSTGEGYQLAEAVGHRIVQPRPALVPLEVGSKSFKLLDGLLLKNISLSLWIDGKKVDEEFGELQFMDFGISGPVTLTLSHQVVDALLAKREVTMVLDLKPALDHKKMDDRLQREFQESAKKQLQTIFKNLLPKQMISFFIQELNLDADKKGNEITAKERKRIRMGFKELQIPISGYRPFSEAIVTAGGVSLKEISSKTMESKKVKGLFFAGEVMDIQADTGGFNLQAAFSTGRLAARSALDYLPK